jgi:hypothetical protein
MPRWRFYLPNWRAEKVNEGEHCLWQYAMEMCGNAARESTSGRTKRSTGKPAEQSGSRSSLRSRAVMTACGPVMRI